MRLGDVLTAAPGYERALSAALGPLAAALVASDEEAAGRTEETTGPQLTVLYPLAASPEPKAGSMFHHVRIRQGFELVARRLLGHVVVGVDVTVAGVYREPGLIRAGADPREQIEALEPAAAAADAAARRIKEAEARLDGLRTRAAGAASLEESERLLEAAREAETIETAKVPELERLAREAQQVAVASAAELAALAAQKAAARQAELERARWHDRDEDLRRQMGAV